MPYPATTKHVHKHEFEARLCVSIVAGYGTHSGGTWDGTYKVFPGGDFINRDLRQFVSAKAFDMKKFGHPHVTKVIRLFQGGRSFPLQERYRRRNDTLEGVEANTHDRLLLLDELAGYSHALQAW